jgi:hypothetical protein
VATSLDLFLPSVLVDAPGCPEPLAIAALRFACIEFCRRTDIVQSIQDPMNTVAGTQDYAVTAPADMVLARVLAVSWQGVWLASVAQEQVQSDVALRGADVGTAQVLRRDPRFYFLKSPSSTSVSLYPVPDTSTTGTILVRASFMPSPTCVGVDDTLYTDWMEGITSGALAKIKASSGQSFSANPARDQAVFEAAVSLARRQAAQGKTLNDSRVQPHRFM